MKNYDKNKDSSYLMYLDANKFYDWTISQKLPVNGFKWNKNTSKFNKNVIRNYDENSNKGHIFEVDIEYPKNLHNLHNDLPFLSERMKINKCNKLICNLYDKNNYVIHIRALKQALNHGLIFKKMYRIFPFNQKAWLKSYIDINTKLRKEAKNDFEKRLF